MLHIGIRMSVALCERNSRKCFTMFTRVGFQLLFFYDNFLLDLICNLRFFSMLSSSSLLTGTLVGAIAGADDIASAIYDYSWC